ncbi:MAG: RDD family protein [Bacteriovoracaceae bacterium]|jgi:uncharacterized RDD family membrane protein YckC|nr:RDD family protein [Bacteriovoracaceae bacterium]
MEQVESVSSEVVSELKYKPAGFWIRFCAYVLDLIIVAVLNQPMNIALKSMYKINEQELAGQLARGEMSPIFLNYLAFSVISSFAMTFFYYWFFYRWKSATPGKMALGLKVFKYQTTESLGPGAVFLREIIGKVVSGLIFMIGYMMAGFRSDKRALHDFFGSSQVVRVDSD